MRCKGNFADEPGDMCGIDSEGLVKIATKLLTGDAKRRLSDKLLKQLGGDKKNKDGDSKKNVSDREDVKKLLDKLF